MASLHDGSSFQMGKPHFFNIILDNTVRDGRLRLPMRFVNKYGNELSNPVQLKVPNGDLWSVEFDKSTDGEIWLQKGWRVFMEHYSLTHGSFLVFEYLTNCRFHVFMFDKTASEIAYPFYMNNVEQDNLQEPNMDDTSADDKSVQILDSKVRKRTEESSALGCPRPNKKSKKNAGKAKSRLSLLKSYHNGKVSAAGSFRLRSPHASDARSNFTSEYPFFVLALRLYQIEGNDVRLPRFIVNLMNRKQRKESIMLQVGGESWPVKLLSPSGRLSGGWRAFAKDNSLHVGDVCAFEMIKKDLLLVSIFRNGS